MIGIRSSREDSSSPARPTSTSWADRALVVAVPVGVVGALGALTLYDPVYYLPVTVALALGLLLPGLCARGHMSVESVLIAMLVVVVLVPAGITLPGPLRSYGNPGLLLVLLAAGSWGIAQLSGDGAPGPRRAPVRRILAVWVTAALLAYVAGMARSLQPIEAASADRTLVRTVALVCMCLLVAERVRTRRSLDRLLKVLVLCVCSAAVLALVQSVVLTFDYTALLTSVGLTENDVVAGSELRNSSRRVNGSFSHPIEFAVVLAMALPLALHYGRSEATRRRRGFFLVCAALVGAVSLLTVSRSAVLACAVALAVMAIHSKGRRLATLVLGSFVGLLAVAIAKPGLLGGLMSLFTNAGQDSSVTGRTEDYAAVGTLVADHLWFGRGLGTFVPTAYFYLDNQYLGSLLDGGLVGVAALAVLFLGTYGTLRRAARRAQSPTDRELAQALKAAVAVAIVTAVTFDLLGFVQVTIVFFVLVGAAGALSRFVDDGRAPLEQRAPASPARA